MELTGAQWDTGLHKYNRTPPLSSVEANTDEIHNQRQKTDKVASVLLFFIYLLRRKKTNKQKSIYYNIYITYSN